MCTKKYYHAKMLGLALFKFKPWVNVRRVHSVQTGNQKRKMTHPWHIRMKSRPTESTECWVVICRKTRFHKASRLWKPRKLFRGAAFQEHLLLIHFWETIHIKAWWGFFTPFSSSGSLFVLYGAWSTLVVLDVDGPYCPHRPRWAKEGSWSFHSRLGTLYHHFLGSCGRGARPSLEVGGVKLGDAKCWCASRANCSSSSTILSLPSRVQSVMRDLFLVAATELWFLLTLQDSSSLLVINRNTWKHKKPNAPDASDVFSMVFVMFYQFSSLWFSQVDAMKNMLTSYPTGLVACVARHRMTLSIWWTSKHL